MCVKMNMLRYLCVFLMFVSRQLIKTDEVEYTSVTKRALQKSHEKPRLEKLSDMFLDKYFTEKDSSLIKLLKLVASRYLSDCTTTILYDEFTETEDHTFLQKLFQEYHLTYVHGKIPKDYDIKLGELVSKNDKKCVHFIIFIQDVMRCQDVLEIQNEKVVVVTKSSQWRVQDFLASEYSQEIANLLIIVKSNRFIQEKGEAQYILYTHKLFVDALGSSQPQVLTSWSGERFSRNVALFQPKLSHGFSGHRFLISVGHQPPFVIKKGRNDKDEMEYDGVEIKMISLLSQMFNFSTDYKEALDAKTIGAGEAVVKAVKEGNINLGIGGVFLTEDRFKEGNMYHWHSEDCAAFITLASTALPRYRAIMGPFRWTVWLGLVLIYVGAIFLFTYSDRLTLKHLLKNPEEIENMFWYVFGTFTNCFTFGKKSWTKAEKNNTKLLIGVYWIFTIIITACYTGSIIAFVTLPVFPAVIDTIDQLLGGHFQIGMLNKGGWPKWFLNVSDIPSQKLLKKVDFVPDIESGLKNVTKAFFWPYGYLGSREQLTFIVKTNFSLESKRSLLHITEQCFVSFKVGMVLPKHSVYSELFANGIQLILQSGLAIKMKNDVEWNIRSATGKLLAANYKGSTLKTLSYEDRALTLDDTQGMFLLLGAGFLIGVAILLSEIFGGCLKLFKRIEKSRATSSCSSYPSNPRFHERQTPRERHQSVSLSYSERIRSRSLLSDQMKIEKPHFEEQFGEDLNEYKKQNTSDDRIKNDEIVEADSDSDIDYNKEISRIFSTALDGDSESDLNQSLNHATKEILDE